MSASPQEPGPDVPPPPGPDPAGTSTRPLPLRRFLKRLPALPLD
ncbi:hypothetical protein [Petropleomorpha daqingensis]|uniref:Uncharacterized protein n=1 Tax=Petropleomorpha daqingensis TaxID=2026353 RepID=A0A853C9W6_9ACTN|nr:hypothetical protein [Petropleomorpha daqingensis]NYJ04730.1 hypothetical protein [Petropleomorpha daqingensis]